MTEQAEPQAELQPQTPDKVQVRMKLIRRILYFILVLFILPLMMIPIAFFSDGTRGQYGYYEFALIGALIIGIGLIAMFLLSIIPAALELLDLRKKEKEKEEEDVGMFP